MKPATLKYPILLIVCAAIVSRIPYLLNPHLFLDGDECIIALMAKLMYEGKNFSLFFWGQNYGLAIFETLAIIPFYLLLGYTTLAVKLGIFSLWIVGVIFLYRALVAITGGNIYISFIVTLFFVLFPAWGSWCMKPTGGYVTAFMLSNILLYLVFAKRIRKGILLFIISGIILELIFESQRLWLAGLLPLTLYALRKEYSIAKVLSMLGVLTVLLYFFHTYKQGITIVHTMPLELPEANKVQSYITRFPDYLYHSLCGDYYFNQFPNHDLFIAIMAAIGYILFFALFIIGVYRLFNRKKDYLFFVSLIFMPVTFGYTFVTYIMEGRYLIPVAGFLCIPLALYLKGYSNHGLLKPAAILTGIIGIGSCINFYNFYEVSGEYKKSVLETVDYLNKNHIAYTYSTDCMLPYQIIFYSEGKILSRMPFQPARYQPYSDAVDSAFDSGGKVAMLQYSGQTMGMQYLFDKKTVDISICINPPISEMWKGIEFRHKHTK